MTVSQVLIQTPPTGGVRFAPSPTGRLHIGNLRTAWISWRLARERGLPWVVRFEDIDTPRVVNGAQAQQLADLAELGLTPDHVYVQSQFARRHFELLQAAILRGDVYPCDCSRKEVQTALAGIASAPHEGIAPVYSGHCRGLSPDRKLTSQDSIAWRFRAPAASGCDDFIVARTPTSRAHRATDLDANSASVDQSRLSIALSIETFTPAYQWACAIDDHDGRYDLIVRSSDLHSALAPQRLIQAWLCALEGIEAKWPEVFHTALVTQNDGHRLEKRTQGVTLEALKNAGHTRAEILSKFELSLHADRIEPSTIALAELGF